MIGFISQLLPHLGKKSPKLASQKSKESALDKTDRQVALTARIANSIAHALPGRVRFHVPEIGQDLEYVHRLEALLKAEPGVTSARVNSAAASIVITYKSEKISDVEMRSRLASLIQSASDAAVANNSTAASTGRVTQESASSPSHSQPATPVDKTERGAMLPVESAKEAVGATDAAAASTTGQVTQESAHSQPATDSTIFAGSLEVPQDAVSSRFEPSTNQAAITESDSRIFVYEVVGLHQSEEPDKLNFPIRRSGSVQMRVPFNRMNQEMHWIARLGGKIVSIQPLSADSEVNSKATSVTPKSEVKSQAP